MICYGLSKLNLICGETEILYFCCHNTLEHKIVKMYQDGIGHRTHNTRKLILSYAELIYKRASDLHI